jgi:long-chain acyl-CoA synthetase
MTGDLGRIDTEGHLHLVGRAKNMIVTEEGKNVYPEEIEIAFQGLPVKEYCVFAANYIWPARGLAGERLILVLHLELGKEATKEIVAEIAERNRHLVNYKRVTGYLLWQSDFPASASGKLKRAELADQIRKALDRDAVVAL